MVLFKIWWTCAGSIDKKLRKCWTTSSNQAWQLQEQVPLGLDTNDLKTTRVDERYQKSCGVRSDLNGGSLEIYPGARGLVEVSELIEIALTGGVNLQQEDDYNIDKHDDAKEESVRDYKNNG